MVQKKIKLLNKLLKHFPLILLYFSVLNEFDIDVKDPSVAEKVTVSEPVQSASGSKVAVDPENVIAIFEFPDAE